MCGPHDDIQRLKNCQRATVWKYSQLFFVQKPLHIKICQFVAFWQFKRYLQAAYKKRWGCMWPAGHKFDIPVLDRLAGILYEYLLPFEGPFLFVEIFRPICLTVPGKFGRWCARRFARTTSVCCCCCCWRGTSSEVRWRLSGSGSTGGWQLQRGFPMTR
jgi:hypothetical protein